MYSIDLNAGKRKPLLHSVTPSLLYTPLANWAEAHAKTESSCEFKKFAMFPNTQTCTAQQVHCPARQCLEGVGWQCRVGARLLLGSRSHFNDPKWRLARYSIGSVPCIPLFEHSTRALRLHVVDIVSAPKKAVRCEKPFFFFSNGLHTCQAPLDSTLSTALPTKLGVDLLYSLSNMRDKEGPDISLWKLTLFKVFLVVFKRFPLRALHVVQVTQLPSPLHSATPHTLLRSHFKLPAILLFGILAWDVCSDHDPALIIMILRGRLLTSLTPKAPTLVGSHAVVQLLLPRTRYVPGTGQHHFFFCFL